MSQKYSTKLLAEVAIKPPVEGGADGAIKFSIDSLKMDKNKTWTLKIKVGSIPGTMRSEYNLVLAPNPKGFQSSIREILVQYDDNHLVQTYKELAERKNPESVSIEKMAKNLYNTLHRYVQDTFMDWDDLEENIKDTFRVDATRIISEDPDKQNSPS